MILHDVEQGTEAWHALRADHPYSASNAPAMMGQGYESRDVALQYALGVKEKVIGSFLQNIFDEGHEAEEIARNIINKDVRVIGGEKGDKIEALTATKEFDGLTLLASFDGLPKSRSFVWEHKHTKKLFEEVPPIYYWQMEQQMLVAGVEKAVLTVTPRGRNVVPDPDLHHYFYESVPERRQAVLDGWLQWQHDLLNYSDRIDQAWTFAAEEYKEIQADLNELTERKAAVAKRLQEMAASETTKGSGVKVSVSVVTSKKQTAAAYIKEHKIKLPETELDEPITNYRITVEK